MKFLSILFVLLLSSACIKTADQVNREKRFDSMNAQLKDSQGLVADLLAQMKDLQDQINKMNGKVEELEYKNSKIDTEALKKMSEDMGQIKVQQDASATQLNQIQSELKQQRSFIEKVTNTLSNQAKTSQKKSPKDELNSGLDLIKKDRYKEARAELEPLIDHKSLSAADHNKVIHGLGKVEYYTKNYEKSLIYFSKLFSNYPKSSLAPSSLLFIGRTLKKMGKNAEAKEAFETVIKDYPQSNEAKMAKKEV